MFKAASVELTGSLSVTSSIDDAFDLFSPAGETAWVAGWSPEWLCPASADWVPGQTEVVARYHFVGLSDEGNEEISEMSPAGHAERMLKWQHWIEQYLRDGPRAADRQRQAGPVG